jgi:hypothetical protein
LLEKVKTEGEGAPKHDPLEWLETKQRGEVVPTRPTWIDGERKTEGKVAPKHDTLELLEKENTEGEGAPKNDPLELLETNQRGSVLQNTTHLNYWRQNIGGGAPKHNPLELLEKEKTEGEGAPKHDPLELLETKKRGEVLPNATHLNCWRKKKKRGRVLPNMPHLNYWKQNRGGRCSQTRPTWEGVVKKNFSSSYVQNYQLG